ncbi:MAG: BCCT family transporter [Pseudomonadota bacterium]
MKNAHKPSGFKLAVQNINTHLCVPVFYWAAALIILFVLCGVLIPEKMETVFNQVQGWILHSFGWFYLLSVGIFLLTALFFAASSIGKVRLGPDESRPDFSYFSWFAMLFSAGMGIGLMFFSVAEPIMHFNAPPVGKGGSLEAAQDAMRISFFHWGIHAWAIYAVVGMALAYFGYRYNLPLTIRSALFPLIGERANGPIGHVVDIFAILGTMFGVATSLGLGVMQVNAGLNYLFDIPVGVGTQVILIAMITVLATISVILGLEGGIKKIANFNLILAVILLLFVIIAGPTVYLFNAWMENLGDYVSSLVKMTFNMRAYSGEAAQDWLGDWTLFYWAWWIAWSPFVGMFIARISRGRTIREFVFGVLLVPVGFTTIWMTCFGNAAIFLDMGIADGAISEAVAASMDTALFKFLEYFPFSSLVSLLAVILVITFFVTSSDSGSLVIDIIASGGKDDPPVWQRVFWAVSEGVVAATLLLAGGLAGLQTASIAAALPFTFIMLVVCYGLFRGLMLEKTMVANMDIPAALPIEGTAMAWQDRLRTIIAHPDRKKVQGFLKTTALPAFEKVAEEIRRKSSLDAEITHDENHVKLEVLHGEEQDFVYGIHIREYQKPAFAFGGVNKKRDDQEKYCHAEVHLREGGQHYDVHAYTEDQIISDILSQYERHLHFLHIIR